MFFKIVQLIMNRAPALSLTIQVAGRPPPPVAGVITHGVQPYGTSLQSKSHLTRRENKWGLWRAISNYKRRNTRPDSLFPFYIKIKHYFNNDNAKKNINKANYRNSYRRIFFLHFFYIQNKTLLIHKKKSTKKIKENYKRSYHFLWFWFIFYKASLISEL